MANSLKNITKSLIKGQNIKVRDIKSQTYEGHITGIRREGGEDLWLVTMNGKEICICAE